MKTSHIEEKMMNSSSDIELKSENEVRIKRRNENLI